MLGLGQMNLHLMNERSKKPNHHNGCFKYLTILFATYTSIKLKFKIFKLKKGYKKHVADGFNNSVFFFLSLPVLVNQKEKQALQVILINCKDQNRCK